MKYARNVGGAWTDVFEVPCKHFADLAELEAKLGVTGFVAVADTCQHGDFVDGEAGHISRPPKPVPAPLPPAPSAPPPPPPPSLDEIKAAITEIVKAEIAAISPQPPEP